MGSHLGCLPHRLRPHRILLHRRKYPVRHDMLNLGEVRVYVLHAWVSTLSQRKYGAERTCNLIVMSCSICSIWSYGGAAVSRPGMTMSFGSGIGSHRGSLGSMGLRSGAILRMIDEETRQPEDKEDGSWDASRRVED